MSIRTKMNPMGSLGVKYYTLNVTTDPSSATVTLTYNGLSYVTNSVTVKEGTTVSYSVYNATYGTTSGTITMDKNKTLNCVGTYSQSSTEYTWTQPTLSSNSGSTMTVSASTQYDSSYAAWKAFDGKSNTLWQTNGSNRLNPSHTSYAAQYVQIYSTSAIKVSSVSITNKSNNTAPYAIKAYQFRGSTNGSSWTSLKSGTNSTSGSGSSWTISVGSGSFYNYHQIYITTCYNNGNNYYAAIAEMKLTAKYKSSSYNYYWTTSII